MIPILFTAWWYGVGWIRLRARNRGAQRTRELAFFLAGWAALVLALISPIHPLGSALFSVHMVQHELLMIVAAPLLVLGRLELYLACVLPAGATGRIAGALRRGGVAKSWRFLNQPIAAWIVHALALWLWHVPRFFEATLTSDWIHAAQHISFFGTALLFWEAVLHSSMRRAAYGASVLYLFTTAAYTGVLGALLTFSTHVWYPAYGVLPTAWGFTPLEDQQLGGLIMWVPAGLVYIAAGLSLFASWLKESDRLSDSRGYARSA